MADRGERAAPQGDRTDELLARIIRLEGTVAKMGAALKGHADWLTALQRGIGDATTLLERHGSALDSLHRGFPGTPGSPHAAMQALRGDSEWLEIWATMLWIDDVAIVEEGPLVSVVTATIDRPELTPAVRSVLAQSYARLELIVVDDSPHGGATARLRGVEDTRLRIVRTRRPRRHGRAYNVGNNEARGDIIAALDDDNVMHRDWLRSVVWAFARHPEVDALYGARVMEDHISRRTDPPGMPMLDFHRYDRGRQERANFVDRNVMAFRAKHREILYDPTLPSGIDWDHSLRLFAVAPPLALPVIACYYRTQVADRVSDSPRHPEGARMVRARTHTTRPLRVHVHTAMYPVISETYITEDIQAIEDAGAIVTVSSMARAISAAEEARECRLDYEAAICDARPDIVLMHWGTHARANLDVMERLEVPFACRMHSFDVDEDLAARLVAHPLCVAVYAHPHHVERLPAGVQPIIPVVGRRTVIPKSPASRDLVISTSAGLPKKQFPELIEVMARLREHKCVIILARTNGVDELPEAVAGLAAHRDPRIRVRINVPRRHSLSAMARASVALYTLDPESTMGYPMSIVEAMLCGTIVVAPDRPEAHGIVGEHLRAYRSLDDIVDHVRAVFRGGAEVEVARVALRRRAQRHREPATRRFLHDSLRDGLTAWKLRH